MVRIPKKIFAFLFIVVSATLAANLAESEDLYSNKFEPNVRYESQVTIELEAESRNDLCAKYGAKHTMCLPAVGKECGADSLNGKGLNDQEKKLMVEHHNEQRRKIATGGVSGQPKAADMHQLSWDEDLAVVAQRWADQCVFEHDAGPARLIPTYESVGQNMYVAISSKKVETTPVENAVMAWFNEVSAFKATDIDPFHFNEPTGHYTQLAWSSTSKVGCGMSGYMKDGKWKRLVVCNYGPAGNWIGKPMYTKGDPCTKCPSGTTCKDNLCA